MTKVLVLGSEGYIGSFTSKELNNKVIRCDTKFSFKDSVYKNFKEEVRDACAVIDLASYIDARESVRNPTKYYINNLRDKITFLNWFLENKKNIKYYILASSVAAQYPSLNPYASTKSMFEKILSDCWKGDGRKYAILRYSNVSGAAEDGSMGENHNPETHLIPRLCLSALLRWHPAIEIYGDRTRDYVHVEDVAKANVAALKALMEDDRGSFKCDIGGGNEYKTSEIIANCQALGINPKYTLCPPNKEEPESLPINLQAAKERMEWEPTHDIKSIIESSYKWYQNVN